MVIAFKAGEYRREKIEMTRESGKLVGSMDWKSQWDQRLVDVFWEKRGGNQRGLYGCKKLFFPQVKSKPGHRARRNLRISHGVSP